MMGYYDTEMGDETVATRQAKKWANDQVVIGGLQKENKLLKAELVAVRAACRLAMDWFSKPDFDGSHPLPSDVLAACRSALAAGGEEA